MVVFNLNKITISELEKIQCPLLEAVKELKDAGNMVERMVGIPDFIEYDQTWRHFLHSIDRVWNKTKAHCHGKPRWKKLESKYENLRRKDPLLKYLVQARNVSEHSISSVVRDWNPNIRVAQIESGVEFKWDPWDRVLLPVKNRGTIFNPPKKHLGKPMKYYRKEKVAEVRIVAQLAMNFYVEMINEVMSTVFRDFTYNPQSPNQTLEDNL